MVRRGAKATNGHWDPGTRPGSQSESESGDDDSDASEEDAINRANRALAAFEMALTLLKVFKLPAAVRKETCLHNAQNPVGRSCM